MDYPTPPQPGAVQTDVFYCPFGCKGDQTDEKGYCAHLVGFTTDRETVEPLEELMRWSGDKQKWLATGWLTVNGHNREMRQDADVLVNPIVRDKDHRTKMEYDKYLWVSWRVYTQDPDREPIPVPVVEQTGPRVKEPTFELKSRAKRIEQQLAAPAPDDDLEINPRKRTRHKANEKLKEEATAKAKRRISTADTKKDSEPEPALTD